MPGKIPGLEPFAGVDAITERAILSTLEDLQATGKTIVVVHHDLETVTSYFDHALVLNTKKIAAGPVGEVMTDEVLGAAYGGRIATVRTGRTVEVS